LALFAFAGNSLLARYALLDGVIDAASFSAIRLFTGAVVVLLLVASKERAAPDWRAGSWLNAFYLFLYAVAFSYAYLSLDTGVGALILFAAVQVTMVLHSILSGKRLSHWEWLGLLIAFSGLSYLLLPTSAAPTLSMNGVLLMLIAGIAWGLYSVAGRGAVNPLAVTGGNFLRSLPFVLLLLLFTLDSTSITMTGVLLAIVSGGITSGLGYALWYVALNGLSVTQAALVQLSVPIIAAFGGVVLLNEAISTQLVISALLVVGGILVSLLTQKRGIRE